MKTHPVGAESCSTRTYRHTDVTQVIIVFHDFAIVPKRPTYNTGKKMED